MDSGLRRNDNSQKLNPQPSNMKALITAGGHATRLRPITWNRNKHLIPMANKTMLAYAIDKIVDAGITDIAVNINPGESEIQKEIGDGSKHNCQITYIEQQGGAKGLAHIVKNAKDHGFLDGTPFLMYLGDNILLADLSAMVKRFKNDEMNCLLALSKVPDPERFGVPEIIDGKIVRVEEKPSAPKSDYAITGIYLYDGHALDAVENMKLSDRGEYEITDIHQHYIDNNLNIGYEEITGWWKDTGKPEDLLIGNQFILDEIKTGDVGVHGDAKVAQSANIQGKVAIGKGTVIADGVLIRGPVTIGENCVIHNAYIGPYTSIGSSCEIYETEIEHSIIFDDVTIKCGKRIADSIIGKGATVVAASESKPSGHKLIIGDNSLVEL